MKNKNQTVAWQQYEYGKDYKRAAGIYKRVDENERFYRGDQWRGANSGGLPTPVFNVIRRIADYLVSTVMSYDIGIGYEDTSIPCEPASRSTQKKAEAIETLNRVIRVMWSEYDMDRVLRQAVYDAVLSGDGVLYCYFDPTGAARGIHKGDIVTKCIDSVNLFVSDMNAPDIQSQDFIIISARESVEKLKREARLFGMPEEEIERIEADSDTYDFAGDLSSLENKSEGSEKATTLIRYSRNSEGFVVFEKFTRYAKVSSGVTGLTRYPVAYFSWERVKGSFHGETPISELIHNQKYINKSYALAMKHMIDTAFSKVIYDKRLIPEWDNEVGQAIGVMSGGDVNGAATVVGVGQMQENYLEILESVIKNTKEMTGATEVALGEVDPTNTSAILALRETSELSLDCVRTSVNGCLKELAMIWLEMMKEYLGSERQFYIDKNTSVRIDFQRICPENVVARVECGATRRFSKSVLISTLTSLLTSGHITFAEYLERIPDGIIDKKDELLTRARRDALHMQRHHDAECPVPGDPREDFEGEKVFKKKETLTASQVSQNEG